MDHIQEQKCPQCAAPLRYDPELGRLVCDHCGADFSIERTPPGEKIPVGVRDPGAKKAKRKQDSHTPEATVEGFDFGRMANRVINLHAGALPVYNCVSCGAEVIAPPEQMALTCPYCGNNITLTDKLSGPLRPDGVLPFSIVPGAVPAAVRRFYRGKRLAPRGFFSDAHVGRVTGVYVPFWVFDGRLAGPMTFSGTRTRSHRSGDYIITETDHFALDRDVSLAFQGVPVDASGRVDDRLMDSLEPFDLRQVRPFDTGYLAGFTADRFDVAGRDLTQRAKARMTSTAAALAADRAGTGYAGVGLTSAALTAEMNAKYLLLPVYLFELEHAVGKTVQRYAFAMNGQTGKVVGDLPTDKGVSRLYFLRWTLLTAGVLFGALVLKYFLGW